MTLGLVRSRTGVPEAEDFRGADPPVVANKSTGHLYALKDGDYPIDQRAGVISVMDFGAVGDGSADDTAALQLAFNQFTNGRTALSTGAIFFPTGNYKITSPVIYGGASGHSIKMIGASGGARGGAVGTSISWHGTAGGSMLIFSGANECEIRDLNFDGSTGSGLVNCIHVSADNAINTTLSAGVAAGAGIVATPVSMANIAIGTLLGVGAGGSDIEYVYVTATTGATFTADFTKAHLTGAMVGNSAGSSGVKITGCKFSIPIGAAATGVLWGNETSGTTHQISEGVMALCGYTGSGSAGDSYAGTRYVGGGNVKNFVVDDPNFSKTKHGIRIEAGSGTYRVTRGIFGNITVSEIDHNGGVLVVVGGECESGTGHQFLTGTNGSNLNSAMFMGFSWQCAAPDANDYIANYSGNLTLIDNDFRNNRTGSSIPKIKVSNLNNTGGTTPSAICSIGNHFRNAADTDAIFYDSGGTPYKFALTAATNTDVALFTFNDFGGNGSTRLTPMIGPITLQSAMLSDGFTSVGVTVNARGKADSTYNKATIPYTAFQAAALTKDLIVFEIPKKTKITGIICDTTVAFAGTAGTLNLRVGAETTATGGQELILDHDVKSAPVTKGLADADLGANITRAAAIQGGFIPSWTATQYVTMRLTSSAGNLSGLSAGSVTVYVCVERVL